MTPSLHINRCPAVIPTLPCSRRHQPHGGEETTHPARVAGEQRQVRDVGVRPDEMGFLEVSSRINLAPVRNDSKSLPPSPQPSPPGEREEHSPHSAGLGGSPYFETWAVTTSELGSERGACKFTRDGRAGLPLSGGERVGVRAGITPPPPLGRIRSWRELLSPPPRPDLSRRGRSTRMCRG